jgi:signal transduction histidine kinase
MDVRELQSMSLFAGLSEDQLTQLIQGSTEVAFGPGEELFREGEHADFWWVLLDGVIDLLRHIGRDETLVAKMAVPGRWAGGFQAWDEHGVYLATGRAATQGRVLRIQATVLRELMTAWFPFGGHLVEGLYHTARSIEATARQRESLVNLGTLAAGLAHEINNPASAAVRAVGALEAECQTLLASLTRLARFQISAEQFTEVDMLRREVTGRPAGSDALALADDEEALAAWLHGHGVTEEWAIAPPLAAAGVDPPWCDRAAVVLGDSALEPGLEWVASTFSVTALLSDLRESTQRISALVAAAKSYTQMDRAPLQHFDVTEGLESTVIMLGQRLGAGIAVQRDYAKDVPHIDGYAGELNQVWTNLIDNAVDAMSGTGTLRLSTRVEHDLVVVEVGDTGTGMPKQVAARAFEPFYTTKDVGKGTGLGLDIARRIVVERHGGTITIDSRPGATVLRVRLPIHRPGSAR